MLRAVVICRCRHLHCLSPALSVRVRPPWGTTAAAATAFPNSTLRWYTSKRLPYYPSTKPTGVIILAAAAAIGTLLLTLTWGDNNKSVSLQAKAVPLGDPLELVIVKGYAVHPKTTLVTTILRYFGMAYTTKEYNSLTNDNLYFHVPIVQFVQEEFKWWQCHGLESSLEQLALVCLKRGLTAQEKQWQVFVSEKLIPAVEYRMWRSWGSTREQLSYYATLTYEISLLRRVVHPHVCAVMLPFKRCRQLRKKHGVNKDSLVQVLKEVQSALIQAKTPYFDGRQPGLSDLLIYGSLQAVRNTSVEKLVLNSINPELKDWYRRMKVEVYGSEGSGDGVAAYADKLSNDPSRQNPERVKRESGLFGF